jgi:hypothetical protein
MGDMEPGDRDAAMMAILNEAVNAAADRLIEKQVRKDQPSHIKLTVGHIYFILGSLVLIIIAIIGALSGGGR